MFIFNADMQTPEVRELSHKAAIKRTLQAYSTALSN